MDIPVDWNKSLTHLQPEDHVRLTVEELEWAREYERRQLKAWARFPRHGEMYESLRDITVNFLTHWSAPFTGGGSGLLPAGTRVRVEVHFTDEPVAVAGRVLDSQVEAILVPAEDRNAPKYGGYSLSLSTEQLNRDFRLLGSSDGAA
jgi:hypothetical protein